MEEREQLWTDMHDAYLGVKPYSLVSLKDQLAAICLTMRDAPWAAGLYPTWSMARLGISTSPNYQEWRIGRSVMFSVDKQRRLVVTFYVGTRARTSEVLPSTGDEELQRIAAWVRGDRQLP